MDNQVIRPSEATVEQNSLDAPMPVNDNGFVSQYASGSVYSTESLEVNDGTMPARAPEPEYQFKPKLNFSKRKALIVSVAITLSVGLLMGGTLTFLVRKQSNKENNALTSAQQDVALKGASQLNIPSELQGENESLLVSGDIITRSNLKVSNNGFVTIIKAQDLNKDQTITLPSASGILCVDSNNCNYATAGALAALQAQVSAIGPVPTAGVNTVNNQKGAITIQGTSNQITVATAPNGTVTLSTPQNLNTDSNVQFNSLTIADIKSGGNTFSFPVSGGASQTICTVQTGCGASGTGDISQGGNSFSTAIIIGTNDAQSLQFETNDVTRITINSAGDTTVNGSLTVAGLGNGVVKSTGGTLSVGAVSLATEVSGTLSVSNGGTGATSFTVNGLLYGNGSGALQPTAAGTSGQVLVANGSGVPTFVTFSGDATISNTGVVNLATGSVTSNEIADGTITGTDIAGATVANANLVNSSLTLTSGAGLINGGSISLGGTVSLDIGQGDGIAVSANDIAVDGTVCRTSGNCAGIGGTGDILQGGNSFGSTMTIGTNDAQSLVLETAGLARLTISSAGDALFSGNLDTNGSLTVGNSNQFVISNTGVITSGTWNGNTISIAYGGTGLSGPSATPANGQLLIGNGSGYSLSELINNDDTVEIINGAGSITLSVPRADQCSTCADHTLSNLADIVAINKSLLPASAGAINLGGSSVPYSLLFLSGSSASPASNNFTIGGTATTSRNINFPDADGTLCLRETCIQLSPGAAQSGSINITSTVTAGSLVLGGAATVNSLASANGNALTLGATGAGQTTNLQGNSITFTNGSATYNFNSTTGTRTICDDSGNCAGSGGGVIASGGSAYNLPVFSSANTIINSIFSQNAGATAGTVTGTLQITGATLSGAAALTVSSTGGANALNLSSGSGTLGLTGSTATIQRAGSSLTLDVNSGANSTLTVTNSNGSSVANLNVEGGINIGSGQTYKINNVDINTGGTLNNVAYLDQANNFSNVGTTSFGGPITAGTYNGQTVSATASFTGTLEVQGASALRLGAASTNTGAILFRNNAGSNTVTLKAADSNPSSSITLTLPSALPVSTECLNLSSGGIIGTQSCASGLGGGGTQNYVAKFGVGGSSVGDSSIFDDGTDVIIQGGSLILGENGVSGTQGILSLRNGANPGKTVSVAAPTSGIATDYTLVLPDDSASDGQCLVLSTTGANRSIITGSCAAGGTGGNFNASGGDPAVGRLQRITAHNAGDYTGGLSQIYDNGTTVGIGVTQGGSLLTVGSESDFTVTDGGAVTADGLSLNGSGSNSSITNVLDISATGSFTTTKSGAALQLTGAPQASATTAQMQLGSALVSGSVAGTYIGVNAANGYTGDFVNLQVNGTSRLRIDQNGNITSGTINGVTLGGSGALSSGGFTLTLTGNSTLNQNLTTSSAVQFSGLTLGNALTPANGGTGADTSGALAGAALIFNATSGEFEANRITSSDNSILVGSTDGNIDLVVDSCTTCAKNDLSNLAATTNINSTLRAQTGVDLGAGNSPFRDAYIYGSSSTPASNNFRITGTATGARTITLPDASGTACLTNTCVMLQGGGHTPQSGYIDISNDLTVGGNFGLTGTATINTITPAASTQLLLGATGSGQTARLQGTSVSFVSGGITYNFSHSGSGTHTLCDDTGNCAGAGGGVTASGGSAFYLPVFNSANTVVNSIISQDAGVGATIATVNGRLAVSAANTSGASLAVSNSSYTSNNSSLATFNFTNANSTASATTVNGVTVTPTGSTNSNPNANTLNGIRLNNVTPITNNAFYGINVGTGYDDILRYNGSTSIINGTGAVQNLNGQAASYYLNATNINAGTLSVDRGGTGVGTFTSNGVLYGNGTGAVQVTAAGSNGQCLIVVSGTPAWGSCSSATLQNVYDNTSTTPQILLANAKSFTIDTNGVSDTYATDPSIVFNLNCSSCSAGGGRFAIQDTGTDIFTVNPNGDIVVGTASHNITFANGTYRSTATGNARQQKKIMLTPEYPGTVLDAASDTGGANCATNNNGTMTSGYQSGIASLADNNTTQNYFSWVSSQGSAQCYDVIVQVPIPSDWSAWRDNADGGAFFINAYTSSTTNGIMAVQILDGNTTAETNYNYVALTPSSNTTWQIRNAATNTLSGNYAANGKMTIRIRMTSQSSADMRIGNITLNYLSKF